MSNLEVKLIYNYVLNGMYLITDSTFNILSRSCNPIWSKWYISTTLSPGIIFHYMAYNFLHIAFMIFLFLNEMIPEDIFI